MIVIPPKAHLTSHYSLFDSTWLMIPLWLSGALRYFLYSSVYSYDLFLISSALLGPYHFCPLFSPTLQELLPWYLQFAWRVLYSFLFYCFPLFLCTDHLGLLSYLSLLFFITLYSDGYIFPFLLCLSLLFFFQLFVRSPQTTVLPFCVSSWGWFCFLSPVQCHEPPFIVHQALCLSDLVP